MPQLQQPFAAFYNLATADGQSLPQLQQGAPVPPRPLWEGGWLPADPMQGAISLPSQGWS